jgi:hypothetical protein
MVALDEQVTVNPEQRPPAGTTFWLALMIFLASLRPILTHCFTFNGSTEVSTILRLYISVAAVGINGLWIVESHRSAFLLSPLRR